MSSASGGQGGLYVHIIAEGLTHQLGVKLVTLRQGESIDNGAQQAILSATSERVGGFVAERIALLWLQAGTMIKKWPRTCSPCPRGS